MANLNKVMPIRRLGKDPHVGTTKQGGTYMSLSIATNQGYGDKKKTVWWNVIVWNEKLVDNLAPYLIKGMQVYIQGLLEQDEYDGKQTFQVVVSYGGDIQMLDGKMEKQEEKPADLPVDGVPF